MKEKATLTHYYDSDRGDYWVLDYDGRELGTFMIVPHSIVSDLWFLPTQQAFSIDEVDVILYTSEYLNMDDDKKGF